MSKYSWYNKTLSRAHYWKDKELLNTQRMRGEECINVEVDVYLSKKQMKKGPSEAMKGRVEKREDA